MAVSADERGYYLAFNHFPKIGPVSLQGLENYFPGLETAFRAPAMELEKAGLKPKVAEEFSRWRRSWREAPVLARLAQAGIAYITRNESAYPAWLTETPSPPPLLYYIGALGDKAADSLAVVGSRRPSAYAAKAIAELLPEISGKGIPIISGLATGVDSLAHQAALDNSGRTLAVLGSGLLRLYPETNRGLAKKIIEAGGAILSEFPPETPPLKANFPQRNRIISGLAKATLVIEAAARSGALITAHFALEQNREVLAVPGNIFSPLSAGTNNLIKAGAKTVTDVGDILEIFGLECQTTVREKAQTQRAYQPADETERIVYDCLREAAERSETITADEIVKRSGLDIAAVNSKLSLLELCGIAQNDGFRYDLK